MLIQLILVGSGVGVALWHQLKRNDRPSKGKCSERQDRSRSFSIKKLVHDVKNPVWKDERQQLHLNLDPATREDLERRKQEQNRQLVLFTGAFGLACLGSFSPAFFLLGSASVLYLGRDIFQIVWQDFKQKHYIGVNLVSAFLLIGLIASRKLVVAAIAGILGGCLVKLIKQVEDSSQKQLIDVFSAHPSQVWLEKDGVEIQVAFESIQKDDVVVVNAGEIIPVDGIIRTGCVSIDQQILTGESLPVDRGPGENVFATTLVLAGRISILVATVGEETVAANIGHVLNNTGSYKDSLMLRGKRIADSFVPLEFAAAAVTYGLLGPLPAMAVLWSGLGYRMILYGPLSVLNYLQVLARQGILVKDGRVLESLRLVDTVVFDKTGTLTMERPEIGVIHVLADFDEKQLLYYSASAEYNQSHPIAKAIIDKARDLGVVPSAPESSDYEVGFGIKIQLEQKRVYVGSLRFMEREGLPLPKQLDELEQCAGTTGHTLIYVGVDNVIAGVLEMQPNIRSEAHELVKSLKQRGMTTYVISGDHEQPTRSLANQLGVDYYFAETLPESKADIINQLRDKGKFVCFVGDGINDAIAMRSAQIPVSLKGASSAATDTAQIIFMDGTLVPLNQLFKITDEFERTMRNNFLLSIAPGIINIGGVYLLDFGVAASMILFYIGTTAGLPNTILPLLRHPDSAAQKTDHSDHG
ncbi:MAG: heavy metal translocating P-type ATPase [Methylococcales bacterium]